MVHIPAGTSQRASRHDPQSDKDIRDVVAVMALYIKGLHFILGRLLEKECIKIVLKGVHTLKSLLSIHMILLPNTSNKM